MQPTQLNDRPSRVGLAIGATALLAITSTFTAGLPALHAEDTPTAQQPEASSSPAQQTATSSKPQRRGQTPDYWAGRYWDTPKGDTFWHNLKRDRTATPVDRSSKRRSSARKRN